MGQHNRRKGEIVRRAAKVGKSGKYKNAWSMRKYDESFCKYDESFFISLGREMKNVIR